MGTQTADRAHDILRRPPPRLDSIFAPKTVAIIGASEKPGSVGRILLQNLLAGSLRGAIYPVNPKHSHILGVKAFPNIKEAPHPIDLAIIATPASVVPEVVSECVQAGVAGAIIISAGFKECGPKGEELERQIVANAAGRLRIIGPNCLGVMVPHAGFNATFAATMARQGSVAFLSQSGALCSAILDWSLGQNVGFSAFVSLGSMLDVSWGDLIDYLGDDPRTKSIILYMESIGDARAFLSAAREAALAKPIIVIKVGRTTQASKAAASHTGSLTGNDEVLSTAFRRAGVLRVDTIADLFNMAEVLGMQPRPKGPRLAIITNAGGPGALATDELITQGGTLAELSPESRKTFNTLLPPFWSQSNPVDILGDANAERYAKSIETIANDPENDGVLVVLTPQAMTESTATAERMKAFASLQHKPILASWMGDKSVEAGTALLTEANIPVYDYPDTAARVFCLMWRYSDNLRMLYETPSRMPELGEAAVNRVAVGKIIEAARHQNRTLLSEIEAKEILNAYGIPTVETRLALSEDEAVSLAKEIDGPVVLKIYSETITHKSDVGGVKLNLCGSEAVRQAWREIKASISSAKGSDAFTGVSVQPMIVSQEAYELILGSTTDPQFGPVLLFGAGGQLVEVYKDHATGLPPLNATLARRMMERTRIYTALKGVRGRQPINIDELEQLLVRFSYLVAEQPWIAESDINPLLVSPRGFLALDARIVLHEKSIRSPPRLAIRPYPIQYITHWKLKDGTPITIRPIRPEDEFLMVKFHKTLSERSVHYRYCGMLELDHRIAHERLTRICFNDYDREIALVIHHQNPDTKGEEILGVGRLSRSHTRNEAEFAIIISDPYQGQGLGTQLLKLLVGVARNERCKRVFGTILSDNTVMLAIAGKAGFALSPLPGSNEVEVAYRIEPISSESNVSRP